ncbi:prolipoprotein diacylglyceryl transferase [Chthoniobacter flavus Ellin428]|uniref:Prolipoprotein diacylglyceryl transferase n=1 Tax=Chthoniobacter flavus Ellin428 TaxID=497964 RepID=B4D041_9BACT|nr:prolipoprotein diacylglyceryl transferase family protein [Chthoniobacter flavus]EDY20355.1 prolipoprotein diacylglyceryl transferase [Chthoniobacter flavus Ellin428]TCO94248.1 prolipoprotein diacylglyceryl transferase [Chthoniobacter flavus]
MRSTAYGWLMLAGILISVLWWSRLAKRDERLLIIYFVALFSAFLGAKVVYFAAEGWMFWDDPQRWIIWATGKTILGALLGGYVGVEVTKKILGYTQVTGDWFALIAPFGIALGRVGCLIHGCCVGRKCYPAWYTIRDSHGIARWPSVPVEIGFNVAAILVFIGLRRWRLFPGQHFHLYLIGYGLFRFFHEFLRATPRLAGNYSGYQIAALAVAALGIVGFVRRRNAPNVTQDVSAVS